MTVDPTIFATLDKLLAAISRSADPRRAREEWSQVYRLLQKTALPPAQVAGVVGMRDVPGLKGLLDALRDPAAAATAPAAPAEVPDKDVCAKALQAFRKRLSLTMLDDESKLGRNPMTKGAKSSVAGIVPPNEWPEAVWQELVRQGKLRYLGHGLYNLAMP